MPPKYAFDASVSIPQVSPTRFAGTLDGTWSGGGGVPFGGYTGALGIGCIQLALQNGDKSVFPHVISASLDLFGAPPAEAAVEVDVTILRKGKSFATASCVLLSGGDAFGSCLATFGTLLNDSNVHEGLPGLYQRGKALPPDPKDARNAWRLSGHSGWFDPPPPFLENHIRLVCSEKDLKKGMEAIDVARTMEKGDERRMTLGLDGTEVWVSLDDERPHDCLSVCCLADLIGAWVSLNAIRARLPLTHVPCRTTASASNQTAPNPAPHPPSHPTCPSPSRFTSYQHLRQLPSYESGRLCSRERAKWSSMKLRFGMERDGLFVRGGRLRWLGRYRRRCWRRRGGSLLGV